MNTLLLIRSARPALEPAVRRVCQSALPRREWATATVADGAVLVALRPTASRAPAAAAARVVRQRLAQAGVPARVEVLGDAP